MAAHSASGTAALRRPMASALVTGAGGFVGSALVRGLAARGVAVLALTRGGPGAAALAVPGVEVVAVPDYRAETLQCALGARTAEVVFNLAAAGVNPAERDPAGLIEGNVGVVGGLLAVVATWGVRRFVHTGSCAQYGVVGHGLRIDETALCQPNSVYGAAKAAAEAFADGHARALGVPFASVRPFMVYGPGEAPRRLLPQLIDGLARGVPVVLSPGLQVRDFLYVEDLVEAYIALAEAASLAHRVYNVCTGVPTTVKEVGEALADLLACPRDLLHWGARDYRTDDVPWLVGAAERLRTDTAWAPRTSLQQGLRRMAAAVGVPVPDPSTPSGADA